jgi:hypothetical protein
MGLVAIQRDGIKRRLRTIARLFGPECQWIWKLVWLFLLTAKLISNLSKYETLEPITYGSFQAM